MQRQTRSAAGGTSGYQSRTARCGAVAQARPVGHVGDLHLPQNRRPICPANPAAGPRRARVAAVFRFTHPAVDARRQDGDSLWAARCTAAHAGRQGREGFGINPRNLCRPVLAARRQLTCTGGAVACRRAKNPPTSALNARLRGSSFVGNARCEDGRTAMSIRLATPACCPSGAAGAR